MRILMLVLLFAVIGGVSNAEPLVMDSVVIKSGPVIVDSETRELRDAPDIEYLPEVQVARAEIARLSKEWRSAKSDREKRYIMHQIKIQRLVMCLSLPRQ